MLYELSANNITCVVWSENHSTPIQRVQEHTLNPDSHFSLQQGLEHQLSPQLPRTAAPAVTSAAKDCGTSGHRLTDRAILATEHD